MDDNSAERKRVLIVDDERDLLDIVNLTVRDEAITTELAKNGAMALEKIHSFRPQLIILDLMLPIMSGFDILQQMQTGESSKIPVIVHTAAFGHPGFRARATKYPNVVAFLEKPAPIDLLKETILGALSRSAAS